MAKGNVPLEKLAARALRGARASTSTRASRRAPSSVPDDADAPGVMREMQLLTAKPAFYVANVDEKSLANLDGNKHFARAEEARRRRGGADRRPGLRGARGADRRARPDGPPRVPRERRPQGAGPPRA